MPLFESEGEVLVLQNSIFKAISLLAFASATLSPASPPAPKPAHTGASSPAPRLVVQSAAPSAKAPKPEPAPAPKGAASSSCPAGMVLVEGDYCPHAVQRCLEWLDPPPYQHLRCGKYAKPSTCRGETVDKRFCIDREEYVSEAARAAVADPKEALPMVSVTWGEAKALCEKRGARLCKGTEWELACEGPEMSPYPYGYERDSTACNMDRTDLGGPEGKLTDHRAPLSAFPRCVSPFGVHDMTGNVDEWVERENARAPNRSALRGGWWLPGRNRCRAATLGHGESYSGKQVGFRCCADAKED